MQCHPDRFMSQPQKYAKATEKAKTINIAYEFLSELLDSNGGRYQTPESNGSATNGSATYSSDDLQPSRTYERKTYTVGFPDPTVTEIFIKSSHIISTAYNRLNKTLFIKFSGNHVYRYFNVPVDVFEAFLNAASQGKYAHKFIYPHFRYEPC